MTNYNYDGSALLENAAILLDFHASILFPRRQDKWQNNSQKKKRFIIEKIRQNTRNVYIIIRENINNLVGGRPQVKLK